MKFRPVLIGTTVMCLTMLIGFVSAKSLEGHFEPSFGGRFSLVDDRSSPVTDRSWPGKYLLIYFGYASCASVCPMAMDNLSHALQQIGTNGDRLQPLFVTLDPRRDTPKLLRNYIQQFSTRVVGLTGTDDQIDKVAKEYHVERSVETVGTGTTNYVINHSSGLAMMAPDGRFIKVIDASEAPEDLAKDIVLNMQ